MKTNAVIYARVSSEKQKKKDLSISAQIKAMQNFAIEHDLRVVDIFTDEAKSGRSANRSDFQKLIRIAKTVEKPFEIILVWKFNRFARHRLDSVVYKNLLKKRGIKVVSINEPIENSPSGKMLEGVLECVDEFYSDSMAVDIKRGMKENAEKGYFNGGVVPIGYKAKKIIINDCIKSKLVVDENSKDVVVKIFRLYLEGEGLKNIANILNEEFGFIKTWTKKSVLTVLKNEVYTGTYVWGKDAENENDIIIKENNHPAIISKETYMKAQIMIKKRSWKIKHPRIVASESLLSGLIYCENCKKMFTSCSAKSGKFHYYSCQGKLKAGSSICNQKSLNIEGFDNFILSTIKERILTENNIKRLIELINIELGVSKKEYKNKLKILDNRIFETEKRRRKLYDVIETSDLDISDIIPRIKELNKQLDHFVDKKEEMEIQMKNEEVISFNSTDLKPYIDDFAEILLTGPSASKRAFIMSFIQRIEIDYPTANIEYTVPLEILDNARDEVLIIEVLPQIRGQNVL